MENKKYKVIGKSSYEGTSKTGQRYTLYTYEIDYAGAKVKVKAFDDVARIGDYLEIGVGVRKTVFGNELTAVITKVHPTPKKSEKNKKGEI